MATVRELVKQAQIEIRDTPDLLPDRAAELLNQLAALMGNCNDEIRHADADYAVVLMQCYREETTANRAKIRAETTPEYQRRREARDTKELVKEMIHSLKYYLKAKADEFQMARHQ